MPEIKNSQDNQDKSGWNIALEITSLGKESFLYLIGNLLNKSVSFIFLPLFTRVFSPYEFGVIEILSTFSVFFSILISLGIDSALSFYFFSLKERRREVISSAVHLKSIFFLFFSSFILFVPGLLQTILSNMGVRLDLLFIFSFSSFLSALSSIFANLFRFLHLPKYFITYNFINSLLSALLIAGLVILFKFGIFGYSIAVIISGTIYLLLLILRFRNFLVLRVLPFDIYAKMFKFGFPLFFSSFITYFLNFTDRWMINSLLGKDELGIYGVGQKFASLFEFLVISFSIAFLPYSLEVINKYDKEWVEKRIAQIWRYFVGVGTSFFILYLIFCKLVFPFIVADDYHRGVSVIPFLILKSIFFGGTYFSSLGTWKTEKTYFYTISVLIGGGANVFLNWILIPRYGIIGASFSTAFSMYVLLFLSFFFSQILWKLNFDFLRPTLSLFICLIFSYLYILPNSSWQLYPLGIMLIILSLLLNFKNEEFKSIYTFFRAFCRRLTKRRFAL